MRTDRPLRVAIITAEVGEGHVSAARALAAELETMADVEIVFVDALAAFGRVLRFVLRDAYRSQLHRWPWIFAGLFSLFLRVRAFRAFGRIALVVLGGGGLERAVRVIEPDVIVSTYPAATSVLGSLRRRGRVVAPTCATITDLGGVAFWAHRAIDVHLVMHPALVAAVEREAGYGSARVVRPLAAPAFFEPRTREDARARLGLPHDRRVVVVSGGGWAVGDLEGAAREALTLPNTSVVCLAGRDEQARVRLSSALAGNEHATVLGFTKRMPDLLAAADVVVHTTGGVTCLEALAAGCPIVSYGAPAGHSPTLARAMDTLGVARHVRKRSELGAALTAATPAAPPHATRSAADEVLAARIRVSARPVSRRRLRAAAVAVSLAGGAYLAASSETAFALVTRGLDFGPVSSLATQRPQAGLVIETTQRGAAALGSIVAAHDGSASFAFVGNPTRGTRRLLDARSDQLLAQLRPSGIDDWLGTADSLRDEPQSRAQPFFVLAPAGGPSAGQYLLAQIVGAKLVEGHLFTNGAPVPAHVDRGAILVASVRDDAAGRAELERLLAAMRSNGLRAVSLASLAARSA